MKVAVTDFTFDSLDTERGILEPLGCELVGPCPKTEPDLIKLVSDADCVITQFAPINAAVIAAMQRARVIVRYGIGVDNVDLDAARTRGIAVCNVPDYCIDEVADHTLALILALTRRVVAHHDRVRSGRWGGGVPLQAMHALKELCVGILGFGRIGREVAARLRAFKVRVVVFDPVVPSNVIQQAGATALSFEELLKTANIITLHCPSNAATRRMINRDTIARMWPGSIVINVGRGDLIDSAALVDALQHGHLAGAGLDVYDPEPVEPDSPLRTMENVIITPHVASASVPAVAALRTSVALTVAKAIRGEPLPNVVNGVNK